MENRIIDQKERANGFGEKERIEWKLEELEVIGKVRPR